jgi:mannosyltransferase
MDGEPGASKTARAAEPLREQPGPAGSAQRDEAEQAADAGRPGPATGAADGAARRGGWAAAWRYWPVVAAAGVMAVLGCWGLARESSMGNDEVVTRWAGLLSLHQLAHLLRHVDAVHGLYYLLIHGWMAVGTSPAAIRLPSVIAMTAAVALTVVIARRLTGSAWASLLAGLIMALTPIVSFYAQTARSYAMVMACVPGATLVLMRALAAEGAAGRRLRWWLGYGALVALGGYLNEMSLLILAAHAVTVALARQGRRTVTHWLAAGAGGAALVTPLLILSDRQSGALGWLKPPTLLDVRVLFRDYFGPVTVVEVLLVVCAVAALLPPLGALRVRAFGGDPPAETWPPWWRRGGVSLPSVAAPLLLVPATLLIVESIAARPLYVDRYVLYGEAGAALLAGAGACRIGYWLAQLARIVTAARPASARLRSGGRWALIVVPGVVVCLCALLLQFGAQHRARTPQSRLFDFGGPSRYVAANARPGDGVLYLTDFYRKAALGYPQDFRTVRDFTLAVPPAQTGTFMGLDKPLLVIRTLMLRYQRIWVVGRSPYAQLPAALARQESAILTSNFTMTSEQQFRGIQVTLWLRR